MKLHIIHTNDMHNHFPKETIERLRRQAPSLLLDSGDALAGSNTVFKFKEPIIRAMSDMGYHAMAMGNREFNYLRGVLAGRLRAAAFPILAANVVDLRRKVEVCASTIIPVSPLKVGLFGLTVPQYPVGSWWEKIFGWRFLDPIETAKATVQALYQEGAMAVFCLSHLGFHQDQKLAKTVKGIHVIFGGHSHTRLPEPVWVEQTAIVQGGAYGHFVGNWQFDAKIHPHGELQEWGFNGELVKSGTHPKLSAERIIWSAFI